MSIMVEATLGIPFPILGEYDEGACAAEKCYLLQKMVILAL
jgi:hypothetical protein